MHIKRECAYTEDCTNADKFTTFWMFPKRFYHLFVLQSARFRNTLKRKNQGKTKC